MTVERKMRTVIAHYLGVRTLSVAILLLLLPAFIAVVTFYGPHSSGFLGRLWLPTMVMGWVCGFVLLLLDLTLIRRVVLDGKRAIWVENGKVVQMHPWYFAANCKDIADVSPGVFGECTLGGRR